MALKYTTVKKFWEFLGINESTTDFQPDQVTDGSVTTTETVKSATVSAGDYYLSQLGVNEDTLKLYAGSTQLTETTHYTFDSDTSKITITSAGATVLSGEDLTAEYEYSALGKHLNYTISNRILEQSEQRLDMEVGTIFADQTDTNPAYRQITNETHIGQGGRYRKYSTDFYPLIELYTTVASDYTTGGTEITLTDATGFPGTTGGTIYIGGNKVTYTSRASNVITVPATTPSISEGAEVRGEVIEVSTSPSGTDKSFIVLTPESDYEIDYDTGLIQLQDDYYYSDSTTVLNTDATNIPARGVENRVRYSYLSAWREHGRDAFVPDEIVEVVHMMAARNLVQRTILKSLSGQRDNFNPQSFNISKEDIDAILQRYRMIRSDTV